MGGFDVDPSTLRSAAKKITNSVKDVEKVKVGELGGHSDSFGHSGAADAFSELMATWDVALKTPLREDADASADKLKDTASNYETTDEDLCWAFASPTAGLN